MAFFGVTREKIGSVNPIPDADLIEVAKLEGMDFQFVIGKGAFKPGDDCLYIPVDSLLPEYLIDALGLTGKLSGKEKNRIKTVRLRGQISQGIVAKSNIVPDHIRDPEKITAHLEIEKYEPPILFGKDSNLRPLPDGVNVYDIEGADRYMHIAESLMDEEVFITEKVEGTNFSVSVSSDGEVSVNQRRYAVESIDGKPNLFWNVAREMGVIEFAGGVFEKRQAPVVVYGELLGPGIQKNIYKFKKNRVMVFDMRVNMEWIDVEDFTNQLGNLASVYYKTTMALNDEGNRGHVPILFKGKLREWLDGKTIKEASNGQSVLAPILREGIVIRPVTERRDENFGRVIIKQRSPEYLAKSKL